MSRRNSEEQRDLLGAEMDAWNEEPPKESSYGSYRELKDREEAEEHLHDAQRGRQ
jgi:hypothetical protein